jgi:hypothetical protein
LETLDPKAEVEGLSESLREWPTPCPKEDQPQPPPMGEQSQPECKIELCTPRRRWSTYHKPSRRQKAVQDQGDNYPHCATLAFHP